MFGRSIWLILTAYSQIRSPIKSWVLNLSLNFSYDLAGNMMLYTMKRFFAVTSLIWCLGIYTQAQIPLPQNLEDGYPRIYITQSEKKELEQLISKEQWAQDVLEGIHSRLDEHVERHVGDPEWMVSRLMMYWKTRSSNVYVLSLIHISEPTRPY